MVQGAGGGVLGVCVLGGELGCSWQGSSGGKAKCSEEDGRVG